jgi:ribosomal protein L11 methyltransferase
VAYWSLRFDTDSAHAECWSDALLEKSALAVDLSDPFSGTDDETPQYGEPDSPVALWPTSRVTALFADSVDRAALDAIIADIAQQQSLPLPAFECTSIAERDWVRETQAQFGPIKITDDLWIVPTWSEPPAQASHVLRLDPGLAFGTGSHPTTRLCLRWLCAHPPANLDVLDYGCGSGILLLATKLLGASQHAYGVDIDPQALIAGRENATANGFAAQFVMPDALPEMAFDLVMANILTNPLRVLAPLFAARTKPGGRLILSGILSSQQDEILECYRPWFDIKRWQEEDGWVLLSGIRRAER